MNDVFNFCLNNGICPLFDGKTYGDTYTVAVKEERYLNTYWVFGRVYRIYSNDFIFWQQGIATFNTKDEAIKAAKDFFGKKDE